VEIEEGKVTVDGSDQRPVRGDSTVGAAVTQEADAVRGRFDGIVPPGAVFVLGDNRVPGASSDSREWGYLPSREIIGTAVMRILPPRRAGWLVRQRSP
jgi:signal peptidase I